MHRFFGHFPFTERDIGSSFVITDPGIAHQIKHVLKLHPGEKIVLASGAGVETLAVITTFDQGAVIVSLESAAPNANEPKRRASLYCAILKKENFEFVVQKATEVGISEIVPLRTARTVKQNIRPERMMAIVKEAAEQSGRGVLPALHEPLGLPHALDHAGKNARNIFLDGTAAASIKTALRGVAKTATLGIFIGPEGGWEETERAAAARSGAVVASLGPLTLRAETAAIVAAYLACRF